MRWSIIIIVTLSVACGNVPSAQVKPNGSLPPVTIDTASANPTAPLRITLLDVGQGDAALVETPGGATLLIDGGPPGTGETVILPFLHERGITHLDATLASHYDIDHIGGLPEVFDGPDGKPHTADDLLPDVCWDRGQSVPNDNPTIRDYASRRSACQRDLTAGMTLPFDASVTFTILAVNGLFADGATVPLLPSDENGHSAVLLIQYGNFQYLTSGDLSGGGGNPPYTTVDLEAPLLPLLTPVSVLHINHHGSQTATSEQLLATTQPQAAVISVGNANPYGHPHRTVLDRLSARKIPIYLTEHGDNDLPATATVMNGPITLTTTGEGFEIH